MRSGVVTIMKKELARFFGDRRLLVSILMPGVLIYVLYSFMGTAMGSMFGVDEDYVPSIRAAALPASVEAVAGERRSRWSRWSRRRWTAPRRP